ncbi:very low-density lipoprotein receptor-like [Mobula hypostoma]|uniref:very low-density lipoprotein receptor-like n=1 Tax=Mobula hypostoma TaxID=723540 RepID=UPI002FC2C7CB
MWGMSLLLLATGAVSVAVSGGSAGRGRAGECSEDELLCLNGRCVSLLMLCNGRDDCDDWSDEQNCTISECGHYEFQCNNSSICISKYLLCDDHQDCPAGDDESDDLCKDTAVQLGNCGEFELQCNTGQCIGLQSVCDNFPDCTDGTDEANCDRNECLEENGKCSDYCWDLPLGYECACPSGLELINHFTCVGEEPFVIFTNHGDIRKLSINKMEYEELADNLENAETLATDVASSTIYWSDATNQGIFSKSVDRESKQIIGDVQRTGGIAVDWIYGHIYWTEPEVRKLSFATLDGLRRKTLFSGNLVEPAAVVVDPYSGVLYWADVGKPAKIERAGMDGSGRSTLVRIGIEKPTGLSLDFIKNRLYWVDAGLHEVFYSELNGYHQRSVLHSKKYLTNPFGLAVFENRIYWSDEESRALYSAEKFTGANVTMLAQNLTQPRDLVIFHKLMQPTGKNWCIEDHADCEFLCVPAAHIPQHYACLCPDNLKPDETGHGCRVEVNWSPSQEEGADSGVSQEEGADSGVSQEEGADSGVSQEEGADSGVSQEEGADSGMTQEEGADSGVSQEEGADSSMTQEEGADSSMTQEEGADSGVTQEEGVDSGVSQEEGVDSGVSQEEGVDSGVSQEEKSNGADLSNFDAVSVGIIAAIVFLTATVVSCVTVHWRMIFSRIKKSRCYSPVRLPADSLLIYSGQSTETISQHSLL